MADYKKPDDNFSVRAAKGQAYNLAVMTACHEGKSGDNKYIMLQYVRHLAFANMLQGASLEEVQVALDNPNFVATISKLNEELGCSVR